MSYCDRLRRTSKRRNQSSQMSRSPRLDRPTQHWPALRTEAVVLGRVKWFSPEKGFGFVALEDGADLFLHGSVLDRAGLSAIRTTPCVSSVGQGLKGRQVTEVLEVKATATPPERQTRTTGSVRGVVKWWNQQNGFGFVTPDMGGQDIFVHATTAARSGLSLNQGMPVRVKVRQNVKGPEAAEIASA